MNKLQDSQISTDFEELSEEQQILQDAEQIIKQTQSEKKHTGKKVFLFVFLPLSILIIIALFFSTIFALLNIHKDTIISGIYIQGISVSGLTKDEARAKVSEEIKKQLSKEITLSHKDYSITISPSQINMSFDTDLAVENAFALGRSSNIFINNFTILNALSTNLNIGPSIYYDTELYDNLVTEINSNLPDAVINPSYSIDGTSLIISNGKDGFIVDSDSLIHEILFLLTNSTDNISISIPVTPVSAKNIDIDSIYTEVHKQPVDAYYQTNPYVVYPSSNGLDFNISLDDAKNIVSTYQEEYTIPLKILYPSVTTNQLDAEAFPDLLSSFSTSFTSSNSNRSTNISLSASKINGVVLMPGETFSYNQVVGQRTKAAGFKEAPAYLNGKVVQEYGGGICQVSSTLYNAVLYANLEITERTNHGFKPSYVKPGLDATVSWGGPDFKFTNNRNYPIKIVCDTSGKILRIYIYGLKTDNDYKVVLDAQYLSTVYAQTVYQTDSSLDTGQTRVISNGSNGCKTATYKTLYNSAGNVVSTECISRDTYNPHNKIVAVGP